MDFEQVRNIIAESLGCDVGAAARGELGWELLWPRRDKLPRYLTLLCAMLR